MNFVLNIGTYGFFFDRRVNTSTRFRSLSVLINNSHTACFGKTCFGIRSKLQARDSPVRFAIIIVLRNVRGSHVPVRRAHEGWFMLRTRFPREPWMSSSEPSSRKFRHYIIWYRWNVMRLIIITTTIQSPTHTRTPQYIRIY